jgi:hypothetical protein
MTAKLLSVLTLLAMTIGAVVLSNAASPALGVTPGHTLLHLNCPPGSHGKPRYDGVGQRLNAARDTARPERLSDRAITAR